MNGIGEEQKDFFKVLAGELKTRDNPSDMKCGIIARVEQLSPKIIVSFSEAKIFLTEDEELLISEWFRFRCNIDKTGVLSSTVPTNTDNAEAVTETHSNGGAPCSMPDAISYLASAILGVRDELLALKCDLQVGDFVYIESLEQKDKYILIDKVLNEVQE